MTESPPPLHKQTSLAELRRKIEEKSALIGIIGLGYVGLPVAASFSQAGFQVAGIDIKPERVETINRGESPIEGKEPGLRELVATSVGSGKLKAFVDYQRLATADVVLIDVETPVDADHRPRYEALRSACQDLGKVMKRGVLVIVESTIAPGTIDRLVGPLLEESPGLDRNSGFYLGACPERVMPGKLLVNLRTMSRVCGGDSPETAETMAALYRHVVEAELDLADPVTAELVKTTENAYRDVQIAFANEVALICEGLGADVWRVRELVNKVPSRQMHLPGAGVGGHCIPKDPWLLAHGAGDQTPVRLIPQARAVNESMPGHVADLILEALTMTGIPADSTTVGVLGYAYLENSDDTRHSPSAALVERLADLGIGVKIHDPWVGLYRGNVFDALAGCDAAVIMVAHDEYRQLDLVQIKEALRTPILVDGRRVVNQDRAKEVGLIFRAVGVGTRP